MTSIEYWSDSYIVDELFIQMCNTYLEESDSIKVHRPCKYRLRVAEYARRISAGRFYSDDQYPVYIINKSDFKGQLREVIDFTHTDRKSSHPNILYMHNPYIHLVITGKLLIRVSTHF